MPTATNRQVVTVTYNPANSPPFNFSGGTLDLPGEATLGTPVPYTVIWELSANSAEGTTLVAAQDWTPSTPPGLRPGWSTASPPSGGLARGILNNNTASTPEVFGYKIVVNYDNSLETSTDPEVVLEPPAMF